MVSFLEGQIGREERGGEIGGGRGEGGEVGRRTRAGAWPGCRQVS